MTVRKKAAALLLDFPAVLKPEELSSVLLRAVTDAVHFNRNGW